MECCSVFHQILATFLAAPPQKRVLQLKAAPTLGACAVIDRSPTPEVNVFFFQHGLCAHVEMLLSV